MSSRLRRDPKPSAKVREAAESALVNSSGSKTSKKNKTSAAASMLKARITTGTKVLSHPLKKAHSALSLASHSSVNSSSSMRSHSPALSPISVSDALPTRGDATTEEAVTDDMPGLQDVSDDEEDNEDELERLKKTWKSPIYSFFKVNDVKLQRIDSRPCHFFPYSKDRSSTSNLKSHAIHCFGAEAVQAAIDGKVPKHQDGSIFAAFARQGQRPVMISHRVYSNAEARAHLVKWLMESNRPLNIVNDPKALLRPFNACIGNSLGDDTEGPENDDEVIADGDELPDLADLSDDEDPFDDDELDEESEDGGSEGAVDELGALPQDKQETLITEMTAVRQMLTKAYARDVTTRWNSMYDMAKFVLRYRKPIDDITGGKSLKLRQYELDDDDWAIIDDLSFSDLQKCDALLFSGPLATIANVIPTMDIIDKMLS
ncbi:hypothetical protein GLOTRDRAFT_134286 [Gloeophyllum trabeum ATCC 11539]|uniref:Uncharacterized protein n=1 Tax=Gloeophyllum trabeum (strain ATCC 11539 / FP-39264 / Madison 617) TaxID=670483 RepID=S7RCF6_GLOTA|nr:uncharacterized protein GLOTRDRAFT_134286 [Gloeophyllum trabeum ATCC 11539]EPQ50069.1 hypothetical protein GLOTRDRAFT_134286 [Gloeophyllum trabeum ATCC 11539]